VNYFASPSAAERYARGRPYIHPLVVERIKAICGGRIGRALDVGCGTGQSARAVADIADEVVATDLSGEMIEHAEAHPRITFLQAAAENLPFPANSFDLLTAGLAFHWFERERFLAQAQRVVKPAGWLAIYNDGFSGEMASGPAYGAWNRDHYVHLYPTPPRNIAPFTDDQARAFGFDRVKHDRFEHAVELTPERLVGYLLTQSNVIAAVEQRGESVQAIADWLMSSVRPFFSASVAQFPFYCVLDIFRRRSN